MTPAPIVDLAHARLRLAALEYVRRGWFVAPMHSVIQSDSGWACTCALGGQCGNAGKHPRLRAGYQPSRDPKQITAWWDEYPDANVGLFPGPSGLVVLDIDPRNGGDDSFAEMEARFGELPECPTSLTGGGGLHLFFWKPPEADEVRSCVLRDGVELKGRSGYLIAPPSRHISGREYAWDSGRDLDVAIPEAPAWLLRLAKSPKAERAEAHPDGPLAGLLGQAFAGAGMIGPGAGPMKATVQCPWEHEHTGGHRFDSSTVVFAPTIGRQLGWFHCSHSHCSGRTPDDVIAALPVEAVQAAQERLGIADLGRGWHIMPPWPDDAEVAAVPAKGAPIATETEERRDWRRGLRVGSDGQLDRSPGNAALLLVNHDEWSGALRYDSFRDRYVWAKAAPTGIDGIPRPPKDAQVDDHHVIYVHQWLGKYCNCTTSPEGIKAAIVAACHAQESHPVREYLQSLAWDRVPRLADAPARYFGARDTYYTRKVFRWWMISAVARVFDPGCQVDHMLILEGPQGIRKSTALKCLSDPWCLESMPSLKDGVRASEAIQGKWVVILNELDALKGLDHTRIKDFLTVRVDSYRGAYKSFVTDRPRQCVFAGTTNEKAYLTDATGARRFWPVQCGRIDMRALEADRNQLWAEALAEYRIGVTWWPAAEAEEHSVTTEQAQRHDIDEWEHKILAWCAGREGFTIGDILVGALGILDARDWTRANQARVGHVLSKHKFLSARPTESGPDGRPLRVRRYYQRVELLPPDV